MNKKYSTAIFIGIAILVVILLIGGSTFQTLLPGQKGVVFRKFTSGLDKENIYSEGFHIIAPWNDMYIYDVKEQQKEETMDIMVNNGLSINVDVTLRFNPVHNKIGYLHEKFGKDYITTLVIPEIRSIVRSVMGRYTADEIYSTKRKQVEDSISLETRKILQANYIDMRALLIRSIKLPENIKQAIEVKLATEQESLAYQFKIEKEKNEAERKRIAAEGEARANGILNSSLSANLLKKMGVEATLELAKSQNTKIIVIGGDGSGLPIILDGKN